MKKLIKAGATSQTIDIFIQDSTSTTGAGKTGLAYNTASLTAYYRKGATGMATAITLATQTVGGAYSSGGFVEIDAANMPGLYRLDLPDAVVATAGSASLMLKGAAGMAPCPVELQIGTFDFEAGAVQTGDSYSIVSNGTYGNSALNAALTLIAGYIDTEVAAILTAVDTEVGAIKAKTDNLPLNPAATGDAMTLTAGERTAIAAAMAIYQITESYRADGTAPTLAQALCELLSHQGEVDITGTTKTIKKFDGVTTAATFTLNNATTPTAVTRAT